MEETKSKKNTIGTIVGIVVFVAVAVIVQQFFFKTPSFDKAMMHAASELNKSCPIMIDKETRLDNAIALPENVFQYNYTLVNVVKDSVDIKAFEDYMKPMLANNIKTNPDLKSYRDNKVTMSYNYKDMNGTFIIKIAITKDLYSE
jgi:hypothetical protein